MDGLSFFLDDAIASVMHGVVWVAFGVLVLLAMAVFGALVLWPMCRQLSDTERALQQELDAQIEQWRAEGRSVVLVPEREERP